MKITDASVIKALEIHTIMSSVGYVVFNGRARIFSLSPHHVSVFSLPNDELSGVYGDKFYIISGGGYTSAYWKAKRMLSFHIEGDSLVITSDVGVGVMGKVPKYPTLPEPPDKLKTVNVHRKKVELSKLLGTRNYKRPKTNKKYIYITEIFPWMEEGWQVKASTLLQTLEIAWRVNKTGKIGISKDKLYITASSPGISYEAFLLLYAP